MSKKITIHGPMQASNQIFPENKVPIYDIFIQHDYEGLHQVLQDLQIQNVRIMIVTDKNISRHYLEEVKEIAKSHGAFADSIILDPGEEHKNLETIERIYERLIEQHFDRNDVLFALGGGVIGDMTGYAAATYLRGIRFIQLPTSLLSMVDSSIGGKTGVDFKAYKNMVGAFYQPQAVYINLSVLATLPDREYYSGFGEIIKHGFIKNVSYLTWLKEHSDQILSRDKEQLEEMVYQSCLIKQAVVEKDPIEKGERALLNFGHTIGHSIEKFMDFSLLHGECVSLGIVAAAYISYLRDYISVYDFEEVTALLETYHLPVVLRLDDQNLGRHEILSIIKHDKKMEAGQIKFVLLHGLGQAFLDKTVTDDELFKAASFIMGVHIQ